MKQPVAKANPFGISVSPRTERRIGTAAFILLGSALVVAATVVVLTLVRTRPLPGAVWLLAPGIPVVVLGVAGSLWISDGSLLRGSKALYRDLWRGVPGRARVAGLALTGLFMVSLITASPMVSGLGHPLPPTSHCAYRVNEQGTVTCTSQVTYYLAGRDDQRYLASWFAELCLVGLAVGASGLVRRRREG